MLHQLSVLSFILLRTEEWFLGCLEERCRDMKESAILRLWHYVPSAFIDRRYSIACLRFQQIQSKPWRHENQ